MNRLYAAFLLCFLLFPGMLLFSGELYAPADEDFIQGGLLKEPLSSQELIYYSIRASGRTAEESDSYAQFIIDEFPVIRRNLLLLPSDEEKGEKILEIMHRDYLDNYAFSQTRIDVILDTGVYNCVSSAVLYMIFAREAGLDVGGVSAVDHAFCYIDTGKKKIDVETTNPHGFNPGEKKEFKDTFSGKTGYSYVPPKDYKNRFYIGEKELIGYIFQNRMVEAQESNDHASAMRLAVNRYAFTRSEIGLRDLNQAVQNMLSDYNNKKMFSEAVEFVLEMDRQYSVLNTEQIRVSTVQIIHNHLVSYLNTGRTEEAQSFFSSLENYSFLSSEETSRFLAMIHQKKAEQVIQTLPYDEAALYIQDVYNDGFISSEQWQRSLEYLYINEAARMGRDEGVLPAFEFLKSLSSPIADFPKVQESLRVYRHNYAVDVHNRFADAYNAGKLDLAEEILEEGIEMSGGYSLLIKDRKLLQ